MLANMKIDSIIRGKAWKIKKILKEKNWMYQRGCLLTEQWNEIARILKGVSHV